MLDLFTLEFMQRAFVAGVILAPLLSILGSFATLRKMAFFADGIAHASLLGVAIAIVAGVSPFAGAIVIGIALGILISFLERYSKISSDSLIGLMFTTSLAIGVIMISLRPGYQPELIGFLFGSILSLSWLDVLIIAIAAALVFMFVATFFKRITLNTLSEDLAWASGVNTKNLDLFFYIFLSMAVVLGVKLLGIILVSALLIIPPMTAKIITRSFSSYLFWATAFAVLAFISGLLGSYYLDLPSGASIVVSATIIFVLVSLFKALNYNR